METGPPGVDPEDHRARARVAGQRRILDLIGGDRPLPEVLTAICEVVEAQSDGMIASILLLDPAGARLRHGAAPSLPAAYCEAIDGLTVGDGVGSCGTAAATGRQCIVADISRHPYWAAYRQLASDYGLAACWSTPVHGPDGRVVATFGLYYAVPQSPSLVDRKLIDFTRHLVAIAVNHRRDLDLLRGEPA